MPEAPCAHSWEMTRVVPGFVVTEKCHKCGKLSNYFSTEKKPPMDEYREGDHFWCVMDSVQTIRFDLRCTLCGTEVPFHDLLGIGMCTGCDEACEAGRLQAKLEAERTWVYVTFGFLPVAEQTALTAEQVAILEDYFNQRRRSKTSRIRIVPDRMVKDLLTCRPAMVHDAEMLSLTPPGPAKTPAETREPGETR